jgi:profilin
LVGTGAISKAAILGQQGGVWAASPGYNVRLGCTPYRFHHSPRSQLSTEEQNAIVGAFKDLTSVQASGLRLAGVKFFTTTTDERTINGKKGVRDSLDYFALVPADRLYLQGDGYVIVKTVQAIIVAEYAAPTQAQEAAKVVQSLADYLIDLKY